jgi:hypothetical protein
MPDLGRRVGAGLDVRAVRLSRVRVAGQLAGRVLVADPGAGAAAVRTLGRPRRRPETNLRPNIFCVFD